jgi:argininosuccinate lyase
MPMWAGRFEKEENELTNEINSSIKIDKSLYKEDIRGSIAHATMLGECNIISKDNSKKIINGLKEILSDIESGKLEIDLSKEDIHMFIEEELTNRIGDAGKMVHTARSRNDQVAVDIKLFLREEIINIKKLLIDLIKELIKISKNNIITIMPVFTHMQDAQPSTIAHYLMAYTEMFRRDISRLNDTYKRLNVNPLGSCALAATSYDTDRLITTKLLEFDSPTLNSLDGVSDRDFAIELLNDISIIMMHLSRFSEEIIIFSSNEFKFIELDDAFSTGSSIMPQKKNPDICELIRGKTGRVYGNLMNLLTVMKGLPLAYNKDMQEDKECLFDSIDTIKLCLKVIVPMLDSIKFNKEKMLEAAKKGFINATDLADYLTKKGMPFRDAYKLVGQIVSYSIKNSKSLNDLEIEEYKSFSNEFENDLYDSIDLVNIVNSKNTIGGPAPDTVKKHIEIVEKELSKI